MSNNKTLPTEVSVEEFISDVQPDRKRAEALELDRLFREITGWNPVMWGPTMIGYGSYHYRYDSGREGEMLATGFSPRKAKHSIYVLPGYSDYGKILERLGKHTKGKSCLYINKLEDIDLDVLAELIAVGLRDLSKTWNVQPS
ncbi:MAG: DUF1801 domain-containing protein [Halioglobus sp.]